MLEVCVEEVTWRLRRGCINIHNRIKVHIHLFSQQVPQL